MADNVVRSVGRAFAAAGLGAMAAAAFHAAAFALHPDVTLEMDRDLPPIVSGLHDPERDGGLTFAWTTGRTDLRLPGLDRRLPWVCSLRFRGGRAEPTPQPTVQMVVDGITRASRLATNDYEEIEITTPERDRDGLTLTIVAEPTAIPGPQDPRELGVQADRLSCRPEAGSIVLPPRRALTRAMLAAAAFGAGFALLGITAGSAIGATVLMAAAQALPLSAGSAPYGGYADQLLRFAVTIVLAMVIVHHGLERWSGQRLRQTARFVIAFSGAALFLKLAALVHPAKATVDALFQAHRLEWVLSGRYFFTQPMPDGVEFPYAIGLYVFAAPWTAFTGDYVTLLRVVVCAADVIAGALLYLMIVRTRGDRLAGALAAALFSVVPLSFWFVGNGNLTNAFAQAAALAVVAAVTLLPLRSRQYVQVAIAVALMSLAFLSHISSFAILLVTLGVLVVLYWSLGGPALRTPASWIALAAAIAVACSVAAYYGHFGEVYRKARRVRAEIASTAEAGPPPAAATGKTGRAAKYAVATPLPVRVADAVILTKEAVGWPILVLAAIGAWRFWRSGACDRLLFAVLAWGAAYLAFLGVALMRVDVQYQRYSYEFVGRVAFATYPAAVILAAYGAAWAWRAGSVPRLASVALLAAAVALGVQGWLGWTQ